MIQTQVPDGRGGFETVDHHDPRYWEGPYHYEPYPKALFRATAGAGYQTPETCVVQNAHEHERKGSEWAESPEAARALVDKRDAELARIAAERQASDRRMSPQAQAEALVADRATDEMVPSIPKTPIKRRGRPKKTEVTS